MFTSQCNIRASSCIFEHNSGSLYVFNSSISFIGYTHFECNSGILGIYIQETQPHIKKVEVSQASSQLWSLLSRKADGICPCGLAHCYNWSILHSLLFIWQWLVGTSRWMLFKWTTNTKLNVFIATYHAPCNSKHCYWTGLLLLVRVVLYVTTSVTESDSPQVLLLMTVILVGGLFLLSKILVLGYTEVASRCCSQYHVAVFQPSCFC